MTRCWYDVKDVATVDLNEVAMVELMLGYANWPLRITLRSGRYVDLLSSTYEAAVAAKAELERRLGIER